MGFWIFLAVLGLLVTGVTWLAVRERRAGKHLTWDPYASRGDAETEFRMREGPGGTFGGGL